MGPGAYDKEAGSLSADLKEKKKRGSKANPAFGSTSVQRVPPGATDKTHGPGHYQPEMEKGYEKKAKSPARSLKGKPRAGSAPPRRGSR